MPKRNRLEKFDLYPTDAIDVAITRWVRNKRNRLILLYKLVDGYTYEETAVLVTKEMQRFISVDSAKRVVHDAETTPIPHIESDNKPIQ